MLKPFLRFLAEKFVNEPELSDYCFVFPNRRSGTFFAKELSDLAKPPMLLPEITTITNFVAELTPAIEANRVESLFILYDAYCEINPNPENTFDRFARWGDVVLSDFSDVERDMIDPKEIFINVSQFKQIKSNYITDELREILGHYFRLPDHQTNSADSFWQHIKAENGEMTIQNKYQSIWDTLYPLYTKYCERLNQLGLTFGGKALRDAVEVVKQKEAGEFNRKRYAFVGFNVLTKAEETLFEEMKKKGIAEFYWDYNSPAFSLPQNKATKFIPKYIKKFPSRDGFVEEPNLKMAPNVSIIGVPTNFGQTKYVGKLVNSLAQQGIIADANNAIDTAIVLPDDQLFSTLLKSIDNSVIGSVNVTMGVSIRNSSISSLMSSVSKLHYQARLVKDEWNYFHTDVKDILAHPIIRLAYKDKASKLLDYVVGNNLYQVPLSLIRSILSQNDSIFEIGNKLTVETVFQYVNGIIDFTSRVLDSQEKAISASRHAANNPAQDLDDEDDEMNAPKTSVEVAFINKYRDAMAELSDVFSRYIKDKKNFELDVNTFCFLLDRLVSQTQLAFEGEPLGGLQIMGVLETRCLDFKNMIIMSMNERIFPRKHYTKSFIPQFMRRGFGMSTTSHQESMYAYYFYRMISRAENVFLIYNSSSVNEESRFIHQMRILFSDKCNITQTMINLGLRSPRETVVSVPKDDRIMGILNLYKTDPGNVTAEQIKEMRKAGDIRQLSAHSINEYISCPLRFYLHYVEGLIEVEEKSDFMEASTFGTIIHSVMQQLYPQSCQSIDEKYLSRLLSKSSYEIDNAIIRTINKEYLHKGDNCYDELKGESLMKKQIIEIMVRGMIKHDIEHIQNNGVINYIQSEKEIATRVTFGDHTFNLTFIIDRLEANADNTMLRIIDYKTGRDPLSISSVQSIITPMKDRPKAVLQLLLYCHAYSLQDNRPIQPVIYKTTQIKDSGMFFKTGNGSAQITYPQFTANDKAATQINIAKEFQEQMKTVINELFNPNIPFRQTSDQKNNCTYCKFKEFCKIE